MKLQTAYQGYIRHKKVTILIIAAIVVLTALVAISAGSADLSLQQVVMTFLGHGSKKASVIVFNHRLPRVITAIVGGIGLAAAGCAMQCILNNPLASASTLGISQGAAFGASLAIIAFSAGAQQHSVATISIDNPYLVSICAFVSALASTFVILGLSHVKKVTPESMILSGVALSALFSGATALLQYFATDVKIAAVVFWTFGDLGRTGWKEIIIMVVVVALAYIYFSLNRWNLNALQSGEEMAKGLGVNVARLRITGMLVSSLTAAVIVSFVGIINFIGLIAPHLIRPLIGSDHRYLLVASALAGSLLLMASDTAARLVVSPIVLPIGAITSFLGAPMFLYLVYRGVDRG